MQNGEDIIDKIKDIVILFTSTMLDAVEQSFQCMILPTGNKLVYLIICNSIVTGVVFILQACGKNPIINWQDSLLAVLWSILIYSINNVTKKQLEESFVGRFNKLGLNNKEVLNHARKRGTQR